MSKTPQAPKEWTVQNGAFVGSCLVSREMERCGFGMPTQSGEDWIMYAVDLRVINAVKQYGFDEPELTSLYHNNEFVACVNVPLSELMPYWIRVRHLYDDSAHHAPSVSMGPTPAPIIPAL